MDPTKIAAFVDEMKARYLKNAKVTNEEFYTYGRSLGFKFKEIGALKAEHFAKGNKAIAAKKPATKKTPAAKKAPKGKKELLASIDDVPLTPKQKKALKNADESTGVVQNDEAGFVWIATPEEIASTKEIHTANY